MNYILTTKSENELYHHGVKGMRWGFRRYQRKDGTLTPAGEKRYAKELEKAKAEQKRIKAAEKTKASLEKLEALQKDNEARRRAVDPKYDKKMRKLEEKKAKKEEAKNKPKEDKPEEKNTELKSETKKPYENMSDEELSRVVKRLENENKFKNYNKEQVSWGRKFVDAVMSDIIVPSAKNAGKQYLDKKLGQFVQNHTKNDKKK